MTTSASQGQPAGRRQRKVDWAGPVIAAVDGSPNSVAALRRAVSQARRRHAELDIVYVLPSGTMPAQPQLARICSRVRSGRHSRWPSGNGPLPG